MFTLHRRVPVTFVVYMLMITCNCSSFCIKDELLSRKKREKKKKTGGRSTDEAKLAAPEKNERWEETRFPHPKTFYQLLALLLYFLLAFLKYLYKREICSIHLRYKASWCRGERRF